MTNRLAGEKSPYLIQHADNPVDWQPWGEEAFARARRENKPIFLSIGYSTCHWCHVMAHESFEDEGVAKVMNRDFVNIKVDREERPDVDRIYMIFVQATTGAGGWPMSVWLTPDLKPFAGGTYFPPEDRYGRPGFKNILERIATVWKQDHEKIAAQGDRIIELLHESQTKEPIGLGKIDEDVLRSAFQQMAGTFDSKEGGFGNAPKFPHPVTLNFLLRFYARYRPGSGDRPDAAAARQALEMDLLTLRKMAAGGMHDQLGGGFHRYSVDRYWHVPHFEKMLYDQAQLAIAYLEAFQIQGEEDARRQPRDQFESVVRDVLDYVLRDMTSPDGGFYSAEDADSLDGDAETLSKREGAFYVWTEKEIDTALGSAAEIFKFYYGVQSHGNAPEGSDPHDEFRGKNILIQRYTIGETARRLQKSEEEVVSGLDRSREILFEIRAKRPRPHRDDKIITSWNGLMISAFSRAAGVLGEPRYREAATKAAHYLRRNLYEESSGLLYRSYRKGRGSTEGFADDYAFFIQALLDLYELTFDVAWLRFATELQETQARLFWDEKHGGYFSTSGKDKNVVLRLKDDTDSAEPSANSIATLNLLRLAQVRNNPDMRARAEQTIRTFAPAFSSFPSALPQMLVALDFSLSKPLQIVIAGKPEDGGTQALLREVHRHFLPNKILLLADGSEGQKYLAETNEAVGGMSTLDGRATAYICEDFVCQAPVIDVKALRELLSS